MTGWTWASFPFLELPYVPWGPPGHTVDPRIPYRSGVKCRPGIPVVRGEGLLRSTSSSTSRWMMALVVATGETRSRERLGVFARLSRQQP